MGGEWTPEPFTADDGTIPFERFVNDLPEPTFVALDKAITQVLSVRGLDLVRTEWLKALGDGLHEFRVRHTAEEIARITGERRGVDAIWGNPHTGPMAGYDEVMAGRRARLSPEAAALGEAFERAYTIAVQLIELRESRGLTQAELAERCGMSQADISRIERGSTNPTTRTLQRIADALDADVRLVARAS